MDKKKAKNSYTDRKRTTDSASDCYSVRNCSSDTHDSSSDCSKNKASNKSTNCSK